MATLAVSSRTRIAYLEHGPVAPDLRHRFTLSYLYELPVGHGRHFLGDMSGIADAFFGGWQVAGIMAAQTGEALNAVLSSDLSNTGSFSYRPDQIANPYNFSFDTATQGPLSDARTPDTRRWIAGSTRRSLWLLPWRPGNNQRIVSATAKSVISVGLTW